MYHTVLGVCPNACSRRVGPSEGHRGPLPASQTPRGSRLGPAPLRLLGSRVAAAPGREGAKEEGRVREESPAGERDGGRRPKLGAAGSPRGGKSKEIRLWHHRSW